MAGSQGDQNFTGDHIWSDDVSYELGICKIRILRT